MYNPSDAISARFAGKLTAAPVTLRITDTSNGLPTALARGVYRINSDVDVWIRQANGAMTVATSNAHPLRGGVTDYMPCEGEGDTNVVGITDGGSGYLYITELERDQ